MVKFILKDKLKIITVKVLLVPSFLLLSTITISIKILSSKSSTVTITLTIITK